MLAGKFTACRVQSDKMQSGKTFKVKGSQPTSFTPMNQGRSLALPFAGGSLGSHLQLLSPTEDPKHRGCKEHIHETTH